MTAKIRNQIDALIAFYESRRFSKPSLRRLEPSWNLVPFTSLYRWQAGEQAAEDRESVESAVNCLQLAGSNEGLFPASYIEDGFKVESGSWVFMGRSLSGTEVIPWGEDTVIIGRCIPEPTRLVMRELGLPVGAAPIWLAYSLHESLDERGVGPCKTLDEVMAWIKAGYA